MLRRLLILALLALPGCSTLQAWKGGLDYNHKTGQASGQLKGATGNYNENTGLNLTTGDNTAAALGVLAVTGVLIFAAYPIQRALRLRKEKKWRENQKELGLLASGLPPVPPSVGTPPVPSTPSKTG